MNADDDVVVSSRDFAGGGMGGDRQTARTHSGDEIL